MTRTHSVDTSGVDGLCRGGRHIHISVLYLFDSRMLCLGDSRKRSRSSAGMTEAQTSLQHRVIQKDDFSRMQVLLLIDQG